MAIRRKPPERAFWARLIFSDRVAAETGGRKSAIEFRPVASQVRMEKGCRVSSGGCHAKKQPFSILGRPVARRSLWRRRLSSAIRLRWYSLALRFKRSKMPTRFKFPVSSFRFLTPPNKPNRSGWPEEKCERMLA